MTIEKKVQNYVIAPLPDFNTAQQPRTEHMPFDPEERFVRLSTVCDDLKTEYCA